MATKPFSEYTLTQLEAYSQDLTARRDALSAEHKAVAAALELKRAEQAVADELAAMPPARRAALAQALQAGGIESGEQFGQIGG